MYIIWPSAEPDPTASCSNTGQPTTKEPTSRKLYSALVAVSFIKHNFQIFNSFINISIFLKNVLEKSCEFMMHLKNVVSIEITLKVPVKLKYGNKM